MPSGNRPENVQCIEAETGDSPDYAVIWFHGLDGDADRFEYVASEMLLPKATRFIFPQGIAKPITSYGGQVMQGWYDSRGEDWGKDEDREGIEETFEMCRYLVKRENERGIPTEHIFFAGFSQGGAANYFCALRFPEKIAGSLAFSTYLPFVDSMTTERTAVNQDTPIFAAHGFNDKMIPINISENDRDRLTGLGYDIQWKTYEAEHHIHADALRDASAFMAEVMQG